MGDPAKVEGAVGNCVFVIFRESITVSPVAGALYVHQTSNFFTSERSRDNVTSESSYMPFIFSPDEDAYEDAPRRAGLANSQFKGRRKFDTRGREVVAGANPVRVLYAGETVPFSDI